MSGLTARRKSGLFGRNDTATRAKQIPIGTKASNSLDQIPLIKPTVEKNKIVPVDNLTHRFKSDSFKFQGSPSDTTPLKDLQVFPMLGKNLSRRSLTIQNLSIDQDIFLSFGNGESIQGGIQIKPGTSISFDGIVPNNEIVVAGRLSTTTTGNDTQVDISILEGFLDGL